MQHKVKKEDVSHSSRVILQRLQIPLKSLNIQLRTLIQRFSSLTWKKKADMPIFKEYYAITNMIIDQFFFYSQTQQTKSPSRVWGNIYCKYFICNLTTAHCPVNKQWLLSRLWISSCETLGQKGFFCLFVDAAVSEITATNLFWRIRSLWRLCLYITLNYRNVILILQHNTTQNCNIKIQFLKQGGCLKLHSICDSNRTVNVLTHSESK